MKNNRYLSVLSVFFLGLGTSCLAIAADPAGNKHDFRTETWSQSRSCAVCHQLRSGMPPFLPPAARPVDDAHLSAEELQAVNTNPTNRLCFVCHQSDSTVVGSPVAHTTPGGIVAPGLGGQTVTPGLPPSVASGTYGSICVRVNSQGARGADCMTCHDVHNYNAPHLVRADYGQPVIGP